MKLNELIENEDGSCTLYVDLTNKEKQYLIEYAFVELLKKGMHDFDQQFEKKEYSNE